MICVRTPTGKMSHMASTKESKVTFCGRVFAAGVDEISELKDAPKDLCQQCAAADHRRRHRYSMYGVA